MRILMCLLAGLAAFPAIASEADRIEADRIRNHIVSCMPLPTDAVDSHLKATFAVTSDKAGKVKSVAVLSYEPHSKAMAAAVLKLSKSVQKCWPAGVKTSPTQITIDLSEY